MKNQLLTFLLAGLTCVLVSCEDSSSRATNDFSYDRMKTLIDSGYLDDAEFELQQHLARAPHDDEARVLLASVSVSRAGISLKDYFRLYRLFQEKYELKNELIPEATLAQLEKADKSLASRVRGIDTLYSSIKDVQVRFSRIQTLDHVQAAHLNVALKDLNRLRSQERGPIFYRGILKLIYFKYLIENDLFFAVRKQAVCETPLGQLKNQVERFGSYFAGLLNDLGHGYPRQQDTFKRFSRDLTSGLNLVTTALSAGGEKQKLKSYLQQIWSQGQVLCDF